MLGKEIRDERIKLGLTREQLAKKINLSLVKIKDIENNRYLRISEQIFNRLKLCLDIDNEEFINQYVNTDKSFGAIIKEERKRQNLSQSELAILSHLSEVTIREIEYGHYISEKSLLKITKVLNLGINNFSHCSILNTETEHKSDVLFDIVTAKINNLNNSHKLEVLNSFLDVLKESNTKETERIKEKIRHLK